MVLGWWGASVRTRATGPEGAARKAPWRAVLPQLSRVQTLIPSFYPRRLGLGRKNAETPPPQSGLQLSLPGGGRAPTSLGFVLRGLHLTYITPQNSFANCIPVTNDLKITKAFGDTVFCLPPPAPQNTMDFSISLDTLEDFNPLFPSLSVTHFHDTCVHN